MTHHDVRRQAHLRRDLVLSLTVAGAAVALATAFSACDGSSGGGTGGTPATGSGGSTASTSGSGGASTTGSGGAASTGSGGSTASGGTTSGSGGSGGAASGSGGGSSSSSGGGNACVNTPHQCSYGTGGGGADPMCPAGYADCNGNAGDGCETPIANDLYDCGACGHQCPGLVNPIHGTPTCTGGHCGFQCSTLFNDCNCDASDGCESDARTDPQNCGSCGHVCPSGVCEEGVCKQTACPATDFLPPPTQGGVKWFTIHGGYAYWVQQDGAISPVTLGFSLHKMPLAGGTNTTITDTQSTPALTQGDFQKSMEIAADDDAITVLVPSGPLFRVPLAGGAATTLVASTAQDAGDLTIVGSTIYWRQISTTPPAQGAIYSMPAAGGAVQAVVPLDVADVGFAADAGYVYWVSNNDGAAVKKVPSGGGSDIVLGQVFNSRMGSNATDLFLQGALGWKRLPKAGGAPVQLGFLCGSPTSIAAAASATNVYWSRPKLGTTAADTVLLSVPVTSGGETILASETKTIQHIVVDATGVYYSFPVGGGIAGGGIRKVCP